MGIHLENDNRLKHSITTLLTLIYCIRDLLCEPHIYVSNQGEVGTIRLVKASSYFLTGRSKASFVDIFRYLRFVLLSCLFLAALWSLAGKGLASWLSSV